MGSKKKKIPRIAAEPKIEKKPSIGVRYNPGAYLSQRPTWRLRRLRVKTPYGWHDMGRDEMLKVVARLQSFETMTWRDIEGGESHWIPADQLAADARECLEEDWQGADRVFSLRVDGATRVFGMIDQEVFYLLWFDPKHEVCPSLKKHT